MFFVLASSTSLGAAPSLTLSAVVFSVLVFLVLVSNGPLGGATLPTPLRIASLVGVLQGVKISSIAKKVMISTFFSS